MAEYYSDQFFKERVLAHSALNMERGFMQPNLTSWEKN